MNSGSAEDTLDLDLREVEVSSPASSPGENIPSPLHLPATLIPETSETITSVESSSAPLVTPPSDQSASQLLLPLPASLASKSGMTLSELVADIGSTSIVTADTATAEMVVAADGSFVDTPSGSAAREFKKVLDQRFGVNLEIRSPYTVTGFVNQHGQQRYRVGLRVQMAPAASGRGIEDPLSPRNTFSKASTDSHSPSQKRRSRLSMHFLPPVMFKNGTVSNRPYTTMTQGSTSKKPRKTRSIPDLTDFGEASQRPSTPGRVHSQSVTSVDAPRYLQNIQTDYPLPRRGDIFGQVMDWCHPLPSSGSQPSQDLNLDEPQTPSGERLTFERPFGPGVSFDSASLKQPFDFLPAPRQLQEKHSFESTMTARQTNTRSPPPTRDSTVSSTLYDSEPSRPASALRLRASSLDAEVPAEEHDERYILSLEVAALTQYSTRVFDVLQTYRGLPLLDRFSPETADTTVIKFSLSSDHTAAPRDDPRFVIWGQLQADLDYDDHSASRDSFTNVSTSSLSKRKSKARGRQSDASRSSIQGSPAPKILLAATIERWIAQLTSDLNYDELLNFFLTYRTYVTATDLCQLLICRFHWALQKPISPEDEKVRRIVRVRTFVAIRYWLLTFFNVDFLPNRELRILVTRWLNALLKDPVLKQNSDGLGIVKRLIKVAKECKQAHTQIKSAKAKPEKTPQPQDHVLGKKFAEIVTKKAMEEAEDSDLDLDFLPEEARVPEATGNDIANANIAVATNITSGISPTRRTPLPISSLNILHRTDHAPGPSSNSDIPSTALPILPIHQSALSRAFVRTIGRLGRWTRVLNSRSLNRSPLSACADVSAFDLDLNVSKDLLAINGGVETYLKAAEARRQPHLQDPSTLQTTTEPTSPASSLSQPKPAPTSLPQILQSLDQVSCPTAEDAATPVLPHFSPPILPNLPPPASEVTPSSPDHVERVRVSTEQPTDLSGDPQSQLQGLPSFVYESDDEELFEPSERPISLATTSTMSFGIPLSELGQAPTFPRTGITPWQVDVASLDDLDLSDSSSGGDVVVPSAPPGLRKPPRRLPLRRDFEFVTRPESVSSLGIISRASVISGPSTSSISSTSFHGLGGGIHQWQMNALVDSLSDDEEAGDVEAALRSLEGRINPERKQVKVSKVDGWVRGIRERLVNGDYEEEEPRFPIDSDEDENDEDSISVVKITREVDRRVPIPSTAEPNKARLGEKADVEGSASTPILDQLPHNIPLPPGLDYPLSSPTTTESKPSPEEVVPLEILQSRLPISPVSPSDLEIGTPISKFSNSVPLRIHRSFILGIRAEVIARHFSMIDRELFMGVKFEELVLDDWAGTEEIDILDWTVYLKDRARFKAEQRLPEKTSALAAVRARFNLTANFVISEIVLTQPSERPMIVGKFVRIAWKCYGQSNFHTLTAIIAALQSEWVNRAMRKSAWHRIGIFETRVLKDLKQFTSSADNFKFIRQATDAIADSKPVETSTASVVSGSGESKGKHNERLQVPTACIPFIGVYLAQLHRLGKLPDLIDPTAPHQSVGVNPLTNNFDPLSQPDVFSSLAPLPDAMNLEPLINVHKQRRIAEVIKSLVAGQHLASRVQFEVDKKLFNRCLRLRALDSPTLHRVLVMHSD